MPLVNHPQEKMYFKYFDFIAWLDSKIKGLPLNEVLTKKSSA